MKNCTLLHRALLCICLFVTAGISPALSQQIQKGLTSSNGDFFGFLEYKPVDYDQQPNTRYPIIIFLHGIGERGNGTTELANVANYGLARMIKAGHNMSFTWNGKKETFLVLSPQCPKKYGMWPQEYIDDLLKYAKENLRIDTNRIYLTGLSMGGGGSYKYLSNAADHPKNVTAVATICAPCVFNRGSYIARAGLPLWSFHAADDSIAKAACTVDAVNKINWENPLVKPLMTIWPSGGHMVWDRVYTDTAYKNNHVLNIYEWFLGQNKSLAINKLPVANAGVDVNVSTATGVATLDGSASGDVDGKLVRYVWEKIAGPAAGVVTTMRGASPSTTVTGLTVAGTYTFQLAVVDDRAGFTFDTVKVYVGAAAPLPNKAPVAKAGVDQNITLPLDSVVLDAGLSTDADGKLISYAWSKVSGPAAAFANAGSSNTMVRGLLQGQYTFRVTVTDDDKATATDDVIINVAAAPQPPVIDTPIVVPPVIDTPVVEPPVKDTPIVSLPAPNKAPIAEAGKDITLDLRFRDSAWISGNGSRDLDGYIAAFKWEKIGGSDSCTILTPNTGKTFVRYTGSGIFKFRVTAFDNKGASSSDSVTVTVLPDLYPLTDAGRDMTIDLRFRDSAWISGNGSRDLDGYIAAFRWEQVSGPQSCVILTPNTGKTFVRYKEGGTYVFRVTAYDNSRFSSSDEVTVTVLPNQAPIANAGPDFITSLEYRDSAQLNSTRSRDLDGYVKAAHWTQVSGPDSCEFSNDGAVITMVRHLKKGVYVFRVAITDNNGAVSTDDIQVTVINPVNELPVAVAGQDQVVYLDQLNHCLVDANRSHDNDGYITSIKWTKVAGPESYAFSNASTGSTRIWNLVEGTYVFNAQVTDNKGGVSSDNVKILVMNSEKSWDSLTTGTTASNAVLMAAPLAASASTEPELYPNPASSVLTLTYAADITGRSVITIYDQRGSIAKTVAFQKERGLHRQQVNITDLKNGMYFVTVATGGKTGMTSRFVKN